MTTQEALLVPAISAVTELFKRVNSKDWQGVVIIALGALIGIGAGYLKLGGLDIVTGLEAGLGAVGLHTWASRIGGN